MNRICIMSRVFAYCRVSTADQTTDNQMQEINAAGYAITPQRTITETVRHPRASRDDRVAPAVTEIVRRARTAP